MKNIQEHTLITI